MTAQRKVRKDFDPAKEYSVNVENCTEKEKEEVQQAFFDTGFRWMHKFKDYSHLNAVQYTNTTGMGEVTTYIMYGSTTEDCNMTAKEFLGLVYEGHVHAESMSLYAEDAKTHAEPWKMWQAKEIDDVWFDCRVHPRWVKATEYRRKPKTKLINGAEVPDISFTPAYLQDYWFPAPSTDGFCHQTRYAPMSSGDIHRAKHRLCYPYTDEGREAAILHAKAMLGVQP